MTLDANSIPDDPEACRALIETQSETIEAQQQLIEKLQHEVGLLKRHIFGQRRERFIDPRQGQLFEIDQELEDALQSDEEDDEQSSSPRRRKGHGRQRLPENLVHHDKTYELTPEELPCPCCGKPRCKVSEAISQQLEFQPVSAIRIIDEPSIKIIDGIRS